MLTTLLGLTSLTSHVTSVSSRTTTAAVPEVTSYEDSIVPGPGCPNWNGLTDADGYGGIYTIHCNAMVTGSDMIMVGQADGSPYVPLTSCLATCDQAVGCYGAFMTADGQCQIVTGTGYGVIPFPGYSAYVRDNAHSKKRSLVHTKIIEPIERAVKETRDDTTHTFTHPQHSIQPPPGCFWLCDFGACSLHCSSNQKNLHNRPPEVCTEVCTVDGCSKECTSSSQECTPGSQECTPGPQGCAASSPAGPYTEVCDSDDFTKQCDGGLRAERSVENLGSKVAAGGLRDGEFGLEVAARNIPPLRHPSRSYPTSSECENEQCGDYLYACTYTGAELPNLELLTAWTGFCETGVGRVVQSQTFYNDTVSLAGGHTMVVGVQNDLWGGQMYLFEEDNCQAAAKAIVASCSPDGSGSQGGYVWYYYKGLVWFMGIDGNLPGDFCLGAC